MPDEATFPADANVCVCVCERGRVVLGLRGVCVSRLHGRQLVWANSAGTGAHTHTRTHSRAITRAHKAAYTHKHTHNTHTHTQTDNVYIYTPRTHTRHRHAHAHPHACSARTEPPLPPTFCPFRRLHRVKFQTQASQASLWMSVGLQWRKSATQLGHRSPEYEAKTRAPLPPPLPLVFLLWCKAEADFSIKVLDTAPSVTSKGAPVRSQNWWKHRGRPEPAARQQQQTANFDD